MSSANSARTEGGEWQSRCKAGRRAQGVRACMQDPSGRISVVKGAGGPKAALA